MTAAERARREAVEQGLPPVVTNPVTLARVAALLRVENRVREDPLDRFHRGATAKDELERREEVEDRVAVRNAERTQRLLDEGVVA